VKFDFGTVFALALAVHDLHGFSQNASRAFAVAGTSARCLKMPGRDVSTCPRPPQVEQVRIFEPCSMPEPLHASQTVEFRHGNFLLAAERSLSSVISKSLTQVAATLRLRRVLAAAEETIEDASAAENFTEDSNGS